MSEMSDEYKRELEERGEKMFKMLFGNKQPMTYKEAVERGYMDVEPYNGEEPKKPWPKDE
jgi:hypothetical protein